MQKLLNGPLTFLTLMVTTFTFYHPFLLSAQSNQGKPDSVTAAQATSAARDWLRTLKARDAKAVARNTWFPFLYQTTNRKKVCEGAVSNAAELAGTLECLIRHDKSLLQELENTENLRFEVVHRDHVPRSLAKLVGKPRSRDRLVSTFVNGDGVTLELLLIVVPDGTGRGAVRSLLVNASFESG